MNQKVNFMPRFLAAVLDGVIALFPSLIPVLGAIISSAYLLLKDGIMYRVTGDEDWKNKSIGKKLLNLEVVRLDGEDVDLMTSVKRNIPLTIGSFIAIIPILGWIIGPVVALILAVLELIIYLTDKNGRRLGDRWGKTQVIGVQSVDFEQDNTTIL